MSRFLRVNEWVIASCVALSVVSERALLMVRGPEPTWRAVIGWAWTVVAVRWCISCAHKRNEQKHLRALCRRVAEHLAAECHDGIRDIETHRALLVELERTGFDEKGQER